MSVLLFSKVALLHPALFTDKISVTGVFHGVLQIFSNHLFVEKLVNGCFCHCTKMFSIKDFFKQCDHIRGKLIWIWSHLLKKSLMEREPDDKYLKLIVGGPNYPTKPLCEYIDVN